LKRFSNAASLNVSASGAAIAAVAMIDIKANPNIEKCIVISACLSAFDYALNCPLRQSDGRRESLNARLLHPAACLTAGLGRLAC
jgi:hypothetical protein